MTPWRRDVNGPEAGTAGFPAFAVIRIVEFSHRPYPVVDRLWREMIDLLIIARDLQTAGAGPRSIAEPVVGTTSDFVETVFARLGVAAKLECRRIKERTAVGRANGKARGGEFGREPKLGNHEFRDVRIAGRRGARLHRNSTPLGEIGSSGTATAVSELRLVTILAIARNHVPPRVVSQQIVVAAYVAALGLSAGLLFGIQPPEDIGKTPLDPEPNPKQLEPNERVERIRRIQLNDLENLPFFLAAGFSTEAAVHNSLLPGSTWPSHHFEQALSAPPHTAAMASWSVAKIRISPMAAAIL